MGSPSEPSQQSSSTQRHPAISALPPHRYRMGPCTTPAPSNHGATNQGHPPDVSLGAAGATDLVAGQVGVVGGGDEVVAQGLAHVLVHLGVLLVEDVTSRREEVHHEAIQHHQVLLPGCGTQWRGVAEGCTLLAGCHPRDCPQLDVPCLPAVPCSPQTWHCSPQGTCKSPRVSHLHLNVPHPASAMFCLELAGWHP